jgi:hypothetical protein
MFNVESAAQPGLAISISLRCPMRDRQEFIGTAVELDRKHSISLKQLYQGHKPDYVVSLQ